MKKTFSIHLSIEVMELIQNHLKLDASQWSAFCTASMKDLLQCQEPVACARRIAKLKLDSKKELPGPRIVGSSTACERQALNLAADAMGVSTNHLYGLLVDHSVRAAHPSAFVQASGPDRDVAVDLYLPEKADDLSLLPAQKEFIEWIDSIAWIQDRRQTQDGLEPEINDCKVAMAELGTGSGKTFLALLLALKAKELQRRTWIAVPSLAIQKQFLFEQRKWFGNTTGFALVSGRTEFVSRSRLLALLDQECAPCAKVSRGAGLKDKTPIDWVSHALMWIEKLADKPFQGDRRRWLMDSFYQYVPGFPFDAADICLTCDCPSDDDGQVSYNDQFDFADLADTVVLTHTYLAMEVFSRIRAGAVAMHKNQRAADAFNRLFGDRWVAGLGKDKLLEIIDEKNKVIAEHFSEDEVGRLSLPDKLIIDEAHLLEERFSSAASVVVSLRRLPVLFDRLRSEKALTSDLSLTALSGSLHKAVNALTALPIDSSQSMVSLNGPGSRLGAIKSAVSLIQDVIDVLDSVTVRSKSPEGRLFARAKFALRNCLKPGGHSVSFYSNSPVKSYPRLIIGKKHLTADFRMLFLHLGIDASLMLSATLYLPSISGAWSSHGFLNSIGLQPFEVKAFKAPSAHWLTGPVKVFLPPKVDQPVLVPSSEAGLSETWLNQMSLVLQWIHHTAVGGVLVLMTSYDTAFRTSKKLEGLVLEAKAGERAEILVSKPLSDATVPVLKERFIQAYESGKKPIWLAVGSAWTGLNLSGQDDQGEPLDLLTDLVIPRAPIGMVQAVSSAVKRQSGNAYMESVQEAAKYLKQGAGRLVRQRDLPNNRRLFFLDGRIHEKGQKMLANVAHNLFGEYPNKGNLPDELINSLKGQTAESMSASKPYHPVDASRQEPAQAGTSEVRANVKRARKQVSPVQTVVQATRVARLDGSRVEFSEMKNTIRSPSQTKFELTEEVALSGPRRFGQKKSLEDI